MPDQAWHEFGQAVRLERDEDNVCPLDGSEFVCRLGASSEVTARATNLYPSGLHRGQMCSARYQHDVGAAAC